jgi:predicted CxxxxCH...CXXCH cytochrome family protein
MTMNRVGIVAALLALATLAACGDSRTVAHGQETCGACHGFPPPPGLRLEAARHPDDTNCHGCHPTTVDESGAIVAGGTHLNGAIDGGHEEGFALPAVHGPTAVADLASCRACHQDALSGDPGASCNACHARAGWNATALTTNCTFCHGAPRKPDFAGPNDAATVAPPEVTPGSTSPAGAHQAHLIGTSLRDAPIACAECHGAAPTALTHVDGDVALAWGPLARGTGATTGSTTPTFSGAPSQTCSNYCHGATLEGGLEKNPAWTASTLSGCDSCHGFPPPIAPHSAGTLTCSVCHPAVPGPSHLNGVTNVAGGGCTSCHGGERDQSGAPPKDLAGTSTGAAVGAHGAHSPSTQCQFCHAVPTSLTSAGHIDNAADARAEVAFSGLATTDGAVPRYDLGTRTCSGVYCHGSTLAGGTQPSIAWGGPLNGCGSCHGVPASVIHAGLSTSAPRACAVCHAGSVTADGTIDAAGGLHLNGVKNVLSDVHPAGFAAPAGHGAAFLNSMTVPPGGLVVCGSCHGATLGSCDACHAEAGWSTPAPASEPTWRTNCTFCHGTKTPESVAPALNLAAPPDDIEQRFTGQEAPDRTGKHALHLSGGGFVPAPDYPCAACHPVPSNLEHISAARRATLTLSREAAFPLLGAADLARLPSPLGTYDPADGTCTTYCHGSTMQGGTNTLVRWTNDFELATPIFGCTDCHGSPPLTGRTVVGNTYPLPAPTNTRYCGAAGCTNHQYHRNALSANGYGSCANCHYGSAQGTFYAGLHANGKPDIVFTPEGTAGFKSFTATWDPVNRTCTATCHTKSGSTTAHGW